MIPAVRVRTDCRCRRTVEGMATLSDLSRDIAGILERAAVGIVRVDARRGRPATGIVWGNNLVLTAEHVIEHGREKPPVFRSLNTFGLCPKNRHARRR